MLSFCALAIVVTVTPAGDALRIEADGDPTRVVVGYALPRCDIDKLPLGAVDESLGRRFLTFALIDDKTDEARTPILGTYEVRDGRLMFRPRFGLVPGNRYRATAYLGALKSTADYAVPPPPPLPATVVDSISPTDDKLPANVLRFHITFSRPMRERREVLDGIHLFEVDGKEIGAPWRDIELWDLRSQMLTLYVHPGRIKQGVNLREQLGPVLTPGKKYVLVVDAGLHDYRGQALAREFRKTFTATDELSTPIDTAAWKISTPTVGTRDKLTITFDRSLNEELIPRDLRLRDASGKPIYGSSSHVADDGRSWSFEPHAPWPGGTLKLEIGPNLEDICGNTPLRAFDHDLEAAAKSPPESAAAAQGRLVRTVPTKLP